MLTTQPCVNYMGHESCYRRHDISNQILEKFDYIIPTNPSTPRFWPSLRNGLAYQNEVVPKILILETHKFINQNQNQNQKFIISGNNHMRNSHSSS